MIRTPGMRLIGGAVSWESAGAERDGHVSAIVGSLNGVTGVVRGPAVLFDNSREAHLERSAHLSVIADLDLTNEAELRALTGSSADPGQLVAALYAREGSRFVTRLRG
ncbi:MAG: hypothetical protein ACRELZ_15955, partial [Candidatus Rokuibacteriota bacterium]